MTREGRMDMGPSEFSEFMHLECPVRHSAIHFDAFVKAWSHPIC
jgi:hypothetical protein